MNQHSREQSRSHYTITDYKAELFSYCDELTSHDTQEKVKRVKTSDRIRWQLDDNYGHFRIYFGKENQFYCVVNIKYSYNSFHRMYIQQIQDLFPIPKFKFS